MKAFLQKTVWSVFIKTSYAFVSFSFSKNFSCIVFCLRVKIPFALWNKVVPLFSHTYALGHLTRVFCFSSVEEFASAGVFR